MKSAVTRVSGPAPAAKCDANLNAAHVPAALIGKKTTFEEPPPGEGFTTVTDAVLALATSVERMLAVSRDLLINVVVRTLPFHFTTAPETNPVPLTVSVNPAEPGLMASGNSG